MSGFSALGFLDSTIIATSGQTIFNTPGPYTPGTNTLEVYHNGLKLSVTIDYVETNTGSFSLNVPATAGDKLNILIATITPVTYTASTTISSGTGTYPFDSTGTAATNLISGEQKFVQGNSFLDAFLIIPNYAPFFANGNIVQYNDGVNSTRTLAEGTDYNLVLPYWTATRSIGLPIYGGILLNPSILTGIVQLQYQTLGGIWCANIFTVLETLNNNIYNPRSVIWDTLTNVQQTFPPINHSLAIDSTYGLDTLNNELTSLAATIASGAGGNTYNIGSTTSGTAGAIVSLQTQQTLSEQNIASLQLAVNAVNSNSPTLTGRGASGTWGINITGNAGGLGNEPYYDVSSPPLDYMLQSNGSGTGFYMVLTSNFITSGTAASTYLAPIRTSDVTPLPSPGGLINITHSLGIIPKYVAVECICLTADSGYSIGDVVEILEMYNPVGPTTGVPTIFKSLTSIQIQLPSGYSLNIRNKSTGIAGTPVAASWAYRIILG